MRASTAVAVLNLAVLASMGAAYLVSDVGGAGRDGARRIAPAADRVERTWRVAGIVRAVVPEINVLVITHEDIPGYMPAMTMGFRAASPEVHASVSVGAEVRFTLTGVPPNVVITAIEKLQ